MAPVLDPTLKPQVQVLVCDPRRNALLKEGTKSDKVDARKLAELLRTMLVGAYEPPWIHRSLLHRSQET